MPKVLSYHDIDKSNVRRTPDGGPSSPSNEAVSFFRAAAGEDHDPVAFLVRMFSLGGAHYHGADQFQIVVDGEGTLGRHELKPVSVHFARAYTGYGPLEPVDKDKGWAFMTLRVRLNPVGTQRLPASAGKLKQVPNRKPWQATVPVSFDGDGFMDVPELMNDEGLFVKTLKLSPGESATCPDPTGGDGQYIVVTRGSVVHDAREHRGLALVFVRDTESAYTVTAGPEGLEALVLNFPRPLDIPAPRLKTLQCKCGFVYDQALGYAPHSIREGTPWEDVPQTWTCPDCGAGKKAFEEIDP